MSTAVYPFPFRLKARYDERLDGLDDYELSQGGRGGALARAADRVFRVTGTHRLPDSHKPTPNRPADFEAFVDARDVRVDTFLYRAVLPHNREVSGGALGTGDGSTVAFLLSDGTNLHKHLIAGTHTLADGTTEEDTLVVYEDGVATTAFTFSGNDTAPLITFDAAPSNLAVLTVDYLFYMPVRFASRDFPTSPVVTKPEDDLAAPGVVDYQVRLEESIAGARFA
jgi:hypothetical protein